MQYVKENLIDILSYSVSIVNSKLNRSKQNFNRALVTST